MFEVPLALIELKDAKTGEVRGYLLVSPVYVGLQRAGDPSSIDLTDAFSPLVRRRLPAFIDTLRERQTLSRAAAADLWAVVHPHVQGVTAAVVAVKRRTMAVIERRRCADEFALWIRQATGRPCTTTQEPDGRVIVHAQA